MSAQTCTSVDPENPAQKILNFLFRILADDFIVIFFKSLLKLHHINWSCSFSSAFKIIFMNTQVKLSFFSITFF